VGFRLGCEAKRILVSAGRVTGLATDEGVLPCERVVLAAGPRLRALLRTAGTDLPLTASRGWLLETGPVRPQPRYAIEQAVWPAQDEMPAVAGSPALHSVAAGELEDHGIVSLLLGARPAGHCLVGTSLRRSLRKELEGSETVRLLAERAARVSPVLRDVPVVTAWSGRRVTLRTGSRSWARSPGSTDSSPPADSPPSGW
jgi:glycine/D-amino acid oxidase-like deaminating enzyme